MYNIKINNTQFLVKSTLSVLEACQYVGIQIPRFCYHENLSVAGNCRMCIVEIEKSIKPVASCALPLTNNIGIYTDSPLVKKARENISESLLLNHPLDCPICDQGGECDLQDQIKVYGSDYSRFQYKKRGVEDKNYGSFIKTIMTRCIHCTRCVRFSGEVAGTFAFGTFNRGSNTEIGPYVTNLFNSEISGNVIDLCPVGALTSKTYAFKTRPWELKTGETVDCTDGIGSSILVNFKELDVFRIQPKIEKNSFYSFITDKIRFSFDSIKKNRVTNLYKKNKNLNFEKLNSISFTNFFTSLLNLNTRKLLFIIDNLDIVTLNYLKILKNVANNINLVSLNKKDSFYYNFSDYNKILEIDKDISLCILVNINLKNECNLLNTKIRLKYYKTNLNVYSIGSNYQTNYPINFINLSVNTILTTIEGKTNISLNINKYKNVLVIIGNLIDSKTSNIYNVISFFKKVNPSCLIIKNESKIESNGFKFLNVKKLNSKIIKKQYHWIFCINLQDIIKTRNCLFNYNTALTLYKKDFKPFIWFNTHYSILSLKAAQLVPTPLFFETFQYFLNLENNIKKTYKVIESNIDFIKLNELFKLSSMSLLNRNFIENKIFLEFAKEDISFSSKLSIINNYNNNNFVFVLKNISKPLIQDFYLDSTYTKNSNYLLKRSQELRKTYSNFN